MKITDQEVIKILKKLRSFDVEEEIYTFPENERDGRTDMEVLKDSVDYILDRMDDPDSCIFGADLREAQKILRETNNGKFIPITRELRLKYQQSDIRIAKDKVNEYNRIKRLAKKLNIR